jgi:hypothetical protein
MSTVTRRAVVSIALLAMALALCSASPALGDGDPASDVLLGQNVFYPYSPPVPRAVRAKLDAQAAAVKRAGLPIKVAIIGAATDLGTVPSLFAKPGAYARFLDQEISFRGPQPLLVVMAAGYGVQGVAPAGARAVSALPKPAGASTAGLARAALKAVTALAAATGHAPTGTPGKTAGSSGGGGSMVLLIVLILAAIVVATALVVLRLRRSSAGDS